MRSSDSATAAHVAAARIEADQLVVDLIDGRTIAAPLAWFQGSKARPLRSAPTSWSRAAATACTGWT